PFREPSWPESRVGLHPGSPAREPPMSGLAVPAVPDGRYAPMPETGCGGSGAPRRMDEADTGSLPVYGRGAPKRDPDFSAAPSRAVVLYPFTPDPQHVHP